MRLRCESCDAPVIRTVAAFIRNGPHVYCNRQCAGIGRRKYKSQADKKSEKAAYDRAYRATNIERITKNKAAYFQRTYDPVAAAVARKERMPKHVLYCRQPAYRKKKVVYDLKRRNRINFGAFADCAMILRDIETEVGKRMTDYEIRLQQGTLNKAQKRKKALYEKNNRR